MLKDNVIKLAQAYKETGGRELICLTTNRAIIDEEIAWNFVGAFNEIKISIDGFRGINGALRGNGTSEKAKKV